MYEAIGQAADLGPESGSIALSRGTDWWALVPGSKVANIERSEPVAARYRLDTLEAICV